MAQPAEDPRAPGDVSSALERRLTTDEARLARDEARLLSDERRMRSNRWLTLGLGIALAIAVTGLIVAILALRRDVHALSTAAPSGSVSTAAMQDDAVTSDKLAAGSVTAEELSDGSVGAAAIAPGAVGGAAVAGNSLTGATIRESTLGQVPSAGTAGDSRKLAGQPASAYLSRLRTVRAESALDASRVKGPLSARCPGGYRVLSGGASVEGATHALAIGESAPQHGDQWVALARRYRPSKNEWRLVVTAICAMGG
jgi:hypothetical protein